MRFLADENLPFATIRLLREAGYDIVSILEESPGISDSQVLERAYLENRIIMTFDRDYGELLFKHGHLPPGGIIYFRFDPSTPCEPAEMLLKIFSEGKVDFSEHFSVLERDKLRQRPLAR